MVVKNSDLKADLEAARDRGENVSLMEPLVLDAGSKDRTELTDLALELAQRSAAFKGALPPSLLTSLATLVRAMNCYYSNLIEGHDTHPVDIERALAGEYSKDSKKRNLQQEAKAHIYVQRWIDENGLRGGATTADGLREIHRRFCAELPGDLLWVVDPKTKETIKIVPGEIRTRDVMVGNHIAISPPAVPRFLKRFEDVYSHLGKTETILAAAASHHRLLWIHPFLDGNGRVARLMSHAIMLDALDTGAVWSVARGLSRNLHAYKEHLKACDLTRRNDLDGRGNLSQEELASFARFFLATCLDQVQFMEGLMQPAQLRARILQWAALEIELGNLQPNSGAVLEALLYRGELPRGEVAALVGTGDRQARRVVSALVNSGVLHSASSRAHLFLTFPATLASRWMPGLFPEKTGS